MQLDEFTSITLRACSLETFNKYINQENNLGKLAVLGGHILSDSELNPVIDWSRFLQITNLVTKQESTAKLILIAKRRQYLINRRERERLERYEIGAGASTSNE